MRNGRNARALQAVAATLLTISIGACGGTAERGSGGAALALVVTDSTHHLDALAREPMIVGHPNGTLFVSGYGLPGPKLWRSADGGATWTRVNVGTETDGAVGNSDVDLAGAPDGTLYFVTMGFDRTTYEGTHVAIGVSPDLGETWAWTRLSTTRFDDRPWVEVAPDGTAHVIWNDGGGISYAVSSDGGATWTERPRIHPLGGSSHLAIGPRGELAVRIAPMSASGNRFDAGVELIAVSTDGGATWAKHAPPGTRAWGFPLGNPADLPRWVEPIAWDDAGALFHLWSEGTAMWVGRSTDQGGSWTSWRLTEGTEQVYFPYLIARGSGELAATWFEGRGDSLRAHAARIEVTSDSGVPPRLLMAAPIVPDSWQGGDPPESPRPRDPAGEYLAIAFLRNGGWAVVSPIQNDLADRSGFSFWRLELR